MKRKVQLMATMSVMLAAAGASAQEAPAQVDYYVTEFTLNPTSVSNEGVVVGML